MFQLGLRGRRQKLFNPVWAVVDCWGRSISIRLVERSHSSRYLFFCCLPKICCLYTSAACNVGSQLR